MSVFRDSTGLEWPISFDCFVLEDVKKETGIDLADLSAGGWWAIENDVSAVGRVLSVVCRHEITTRGLDAKTFARRIRGQSIEAARDALVSEGADFFPRSQWSALLSNLKKRRDGATATADLTALEPLLRAIELMPEEMRQGAMEALKEAMATGKVPLGVSPTSEADTSAGGQAVIPSDPATDAPASAVSVLAG